MKKATPLLITLILFCIVYGYGINASLENISQYLYTNTVYLSYENDIPYFYVGEKKEFVIIPPYIKVDKDMAPLIKKLGFKIDNENYNLIITKKDVNTDKMAIIFAPINGSKRIYGNETVIWTNDPLKLKQSEVEALYTLPEKGEVIARYKNGKPAAIKINNKIYVGFKPNEEVLANLIYVHIVKRTSNPFPYILFTVILTLTSLVIAFQGTLKKKFLDLISALASVKVFVLSRINILDEEKVLLNDTRREIYNYILDNPGCHLRELSKNLNKSVSTITWHLRILEKANLVKSKKLGNKIIYYPASMDVRDLPLLYLKNETQKRIFEYLLKNSTYLRKIAKDLNLNVETVRYNLRKLESLGIVESKEEGNKIIYKISESILGLYK
jgi:predicted transcriptional regulator